MLKPSLRCCLFLVSLLLPMTLNLSCTSLTEHHIGTNGGGARRVGQHVRGYLGIAERSERESASSDEECRAVADLRVRGSEKHDVADHHQWRRYDEEDVAAVEAPREEWEHEGEEGSNNVGWD
jgi:hypothetical protein